MTNADTQTTDAPTAKAPPPWMRRDPLPRLQCAASLRQMAEERRQQGLRDLDADVRAGLLASAQRMLDAAGLIEMGVSAKAPTELLDRLTGYASARLGIARATGDAMDRVRAVDQWHLFRETVRHLGGQGS